MGLGVLEWHGLHNPLGLDGVKADGIARFLAERLGGVVMPAQYWGDYRGAVGDVVFDETFRTDFSLPESHFDHTGYICEYMGVERSAYMKDAEHSKQYGEWELWEKLMVRTMFQIETLGFKAIVIIPGHFPLIAPLGRAIERYSLEGGKSKILSLTEFDFTGGELAGDHAAAFETSLMLALCPELTDIDELDHDLTKPNIGVFGMDPRVHASKEFGERILDEFLRVTTSFLEENKPF